MLKHPTALRQGVMPTPARLGGPALPANPGEAYVDPGVLVLPRPIPRATPGLRSTPTGVKTFAVLVLTVVVIAVIGGLGLGLASGEVFPHRAVLPRHPVGHPVVVVGLLQPDLLEAWPHHVPAGDAPDKYPGLGTELEPAVWQGGLVPGVCDVLRSEDLAPERTAPERGLHRLSGALRRGALDLLSPVFLHPAPEVAAPVLGQERGDVPLRLRDGRRDLLVVVRGGDLALCLVFGEL